MRKIARAALVAVASVAATPFAADAEPMMLTNSQMEAVTAAALIEVNVPITLVTGDFQVQSNFNLTTQVANAIALAFSPAASSFASAGNFAASAQSQQ